MKRRAAKPLEIACPQCHVGAGRPCVALGTLTGSPAPFDGIHRTRRELAKATPLAKAVTPKCSCTNHLGAAKVLYPSRQAAVRWASTSRRVKGMRLEFYICPRGSGWHVRTAKAVAP